VASLNNEILVESTLTAFSLFSLSIFWIFVYSPKTSSTRLERFVSEPALSIAQTVSSAQPGSHPIDDLRPGHWYRIPNSRIRGVLPSPSPAGSPTAIINAWNSGAYDTTRNRYIVTGGGHNDYGGNEIYAFDIKTLSWGRIWGPSPNIHSSGGQCNETYSDGNPASRHTYDGLEYLPKVDRFWVFGGSLYCGAGNASRGTWKFDFDSLTWERRADYPGYPHLGMVSAYDPLTGRVYVSGPASSAGLWEYDPSSNKWTRRSEGFVGEGQNATIDPKRRKFMSVGGGVVYAYDLTTYTRQRLSTSGATSIVNARYPGVEYDPVTDRIIVWSGGKNVYSLNLDTLIWTPIPSPSTNTVIPTAAPSQGTYGRFRYIASKNVFVVVNSIDEDVFIYKLPSSLPDTPIQPPPAPLPSSHGSFR
jgi:hypothetical protein